MADAYRTKGDLTIPRSLGKDGDLELTESVNYPAGSYVLPEQMTDSVRERAADGKLDHLLEPVYDVDQARQIAAQQAGGVNEDYGIFVPEHEAEAHALEVYGHVVVPGDQALELGSKSAEYASDYQQAVRDHGLDRRPVQEHLAQERERVPDQLLEGGQTRTGLPHERGPTGYEGANAENQQERADQQNVGGRRAEAEVAAQTDAPRQRPGSTPGPEQAQRQSDDPTPAQQAQPDNSEQNQS